jgi:hypothetical protein
MEPMQELKHPSDRELESFLDPALGAAELERLVTHLDDCPDCEARLESIEPAFVKYRQCLEALHAQVRPKDSRAGDQALKELWTKMERLEANRSPRRPVTWRVAWLGGAAAAAAAVLLFVLPGSRGSELRAENLLTQAAHSAAPQKRTSRLRIRTRTVSFLRPAVLQGDVLEDRQEAALRERFKAAHYNWQEPLEAQSYADWRHGLKEKSSDVSEIREPDTAQMEQRIETKTQEGALRDASLTLDAKLAPVSGFFQFSDQEWVEITIAPDSPPAPPVAMAAVLPGPSGPGTRESRLPVDSTPSQPLAERELSARLAIDTLHLGAGDPIEVTTDSTGRILVTTYGLASELAAQLRAKLDGMEGVTLRSAGDATRIALPNPTDRIDRILRASQDVSFQAHFLTDMESRFDAATEQSLPAASKAKLVDLRRAHAAQMKRDLTSLQHELEDERSGFRPKPGDGTALWSQMAQTATAMDRLITVVHTSKEPASAPAETWRELEMQFGKLQALAGLYAEHLGGPQ